MIDSLKPLLYQEDRIQRKGKSLVHQQNFETTNVGLTNELRVLRQGRQNSRQRLFQVWAPTDALVFGHNESTEWVNGGGKKAAYPVGYQKPILGNLSLRFGRRFDMAWKLIDVCKS